MTDNTTRSASASKQAGPRVAAGDASVDVDGLCVSYAGVRAVEDVSFHLPHGSLVGVIGPNGAGKSTLLKAMLGLIGKDAGIVRFHGSPLARVRTSIAYVPQRSHIDWDFPISVFHTVLLGTYPRLGSIRRPKPRDKSWANECLRQVGLHHLAKKQIGELSGGQQQRVFMARALAQQATFFVLDEPFAGVDATSEETIISVLQQLRDHGKTVICVHHDLVTAEHYFDHLLLINRQLISSGPTADVIQSDLLSNAYLIGAQHR